MRELLIIPEREHLAESLSLAKQYQLGFEYNDFFSPKILSNSTYVECIMKEYRTHLLPEFTTSHGDFFDVLIFSEDSKICEVSRQRIEQSVDISEKMGVKATIFHTNQNPFLTTEAYRENWLDKNVLFWTKMAKQHPNMNFYIENMFDQTPEYLCMLCERMKSVCNFGVCLDYAHASISPTPVEEWSVRLSPYIKHVHINDNDGKNDLHLALGEGIIDWNKFAQLRKNFFQNASVLIETSKIENQRKSLEFLENNDLLGVRKITS